MHERTFLRPQTITGVVSGGDLRAALEADRFPRMKDSRDEPGNIDSGVSRLDDHRYGSSDRSHPVPTYGRNLPAVRLVRDGFMTGHTETDILQVTGTAMSPDVATAFVHTLAEDPTHPFVTPRLLPGMDLNGSDSWLTVGGPALAIPLTWTEPEDTRARRSKNFIRPEPEGEVREFSVHVSNDDGVSDEDIMAAARRHPSLDEDQIVSGTMSLLSLSPLAHDAVGNGLTGHEVPMFKLTYDERTIGLYGTAAEAGDALEKELTDAARYRHSGYLLEDRFRPEFAGRYTVEGCLAQDGKEVTRSVDLRLVEADAIVEARVVTMDPAASPPVAGWMLVWQARDWHRNPELVTQLVDDDGTVLAGNRSRWR